MIEDVDFMKENSIKQTYMFLVDSKDRNRVAYPTPSEYIVEFTAPFQNVIGMDVVDATIPRTMYNVDLYNNNIVFAIHQSNIDLNPSMYVQRTIPVGDYTIQTLIPALNSVMNNYVNNNSNFPNVSIVASATTNPPDICNLLQFQCSYPFIFDMKASSISETLGFDTYVDSSQFRLPVTTRLYNPILSSSSNYQLYHSVDIEDPSIKLGNPYIVYQGPRSVLLQSPISGGASNYQLFTTNAKTYLTGISIGFGLQTRSTQIPNVTATWELHNVAPDGVTLGSLIRREAISIDYVDGGLSDWSTTSNPIYLEALTTYALLIFDSNNNGLSVFYNDIIPAPLKPVFYAKSGISANFQAYDVNNIVYSLSAQLTVKDAYHQITAPGIYNLVGERYIIMRCIEIEEHGYRSLAYTKHNLGLAKFRMGIVGYGDHRMDFSSVPMREFHPIGKLNRISLRFERSDGSLYDFKGVNHTVTFSIKYFEPIQKQKFGVSSIQPNYNGDFLAYKRLEEEQEEESDEEEDFSRDMLNNYKRFESQYMPDNIRKRDIELLYQMELEDDDDA